MASGGKGASITFSRTLQRLKQQGCNLLVVGSVPDSVFSLASNQMLGDPDLRRDRLFVLTDADTSIVRGRLPAASTRTLSETTKIVNHVPSARTAITQVAASDRVPESFVYDEDLDALRETVGEAIAEFEGHGEGYEPGRLRVCFDSLTPLVDEYDDEVAFAFLNQVAGEIRGAHGMGHFLLPADRNARSVERLEPLFDAVVELRIVNGSSEQERWHLLEEGVVTEWMPL